MAEKAKSIEDVKEKVGEGVKAAKQRLEGVARDVEERYQKVAEEMRREADKASQRARETAKEAKERYGEAVENLREGYTRVRHDVESFGEDLNDYVRDNPAKAVLIAALIGFVLGLIFSPSRRD